MHIVLSTYCPYVVIKIDDQFAIIGRTEKNRAAVFYVESLKEIEELKDVFVKQSRYTEPREPHPTGESTDTWSSGATVPPSGQPSGDVVPAPETAGR